MSALPEEKPSYLKHNYNAMADLEDEYRLEESGDYGNKSLMLFLRDDPKTEIVERGMQEVFRLSNDYMTARLDSNQSEMHATRAKMEKTIEAAQGYIKALKNDKALDGNLQESAEEALAYAKGSARLAAANEAIRSNEAVDRFLNDPFASYTAGLEL